MTPARTRHLLYAENFLVAFAVGVFLSLPLYFKAQGRNEVFFGQIFAFGAVGALSCVSASRWLLHRVGLARLAPWGSVLFCAGSGVFFLSALLDPRAVGWLYLASLLQGMGWGLFLTQGPLCVSSTAQDANRAHYFTVYGAYNTLGIGLAPILCGILLQRHGWSHTLLFALATATSLAAATASAWAARNNAAYDSLGRVAGAGPSASGEGLGRIARLPSAFFLVMVMLCACVYTSMTNFQATYAQAMQIDDRVFFGFYTLAVVSVRFGMSKKITRMAPRHVVPGLALVMLLALCLLCVARFSVVFYAAGALLLGVGYGLLYPTIQAQAVHHAPEALRPQALIGFSLAYLLLRFVFPYVGAHAVEKFGYNGLMLLLVLCGALNLAVGVYFFTFGPGRRKPAPV